MKEMYFSNMKFHTVKLSRYHKNFARITPTGWNFSYRRSFTTYILPILEPIDMNNRKYPFWEQF